MVKVEKKEMERVTAQRLSSAVDCLCYFHTPVNSICLIYIFILHQALHY